VVGVKVGGVETCNCRARAPIDRDTHIELAISPGAPPTQRVIVEVTPRFRDVMEAQGVDWSTAALAGRAGVKGQWVEVASWLLFDTPHINEAENTNPGNPPNWRATCWEVHPITSLKVVDAPPALPVTPEVIAASQRQRTQAMTAAHKDAQAKRNAALLAKYEKDDLEEEETPDQDEPPAKK
jgi:hypothetical protein